MDPLRASAASLCISVAAAVLLLLVLLLLPVSLRAAASPGRYHLPKGEVMGGEVVVSYVVISASSKQSAVALAYRLGY